MTEVRYLGICMLSSRVFKMFIALCHIGYVFYRAANAIFGKVDRVATVEIILQVFAKSVILFRSLPVNHKKLSYRRGTARCVVSVEDFANCHATVQKLLVRQVLNQVSAVAN